MERTRGSNGELLKEPGREEAPIHALIEDPPVLHRRAGGAAVSWSIGKNVLRLIADRVGPADRTLETGAGVSTLLFAATGASHLCIVPDAELVERIMRCGVERGISFDKVNFEIDRSERALPRLDLASLDLVLIDGRHAFPSPFIDWYYTAAALRVGGLMMIDDVQLWSGRVLEQFLLSEPEWAIEQGPGRKTAVFRKMAEVDHSREWTQQPFLVEATKRIQSDTRSASARLRRLLGHLRRGEFADVAAKVIDNARRITGGMSSRAGQR